MKTENQSNEKPEDSTPSVPPVSATPVPPPTPEPVVAATEVDPALAKDISENKIYAALSYIFILFLVPMLAAKNSPFASYHAKQGFIVFLGWIAISVVGWVPFLGWLVWFLGAILLIVLSVMGLLNALGGKMKPLPLVGNFMGHF